YLAFYEGLNRYAAGEQVLKQFLIKASQATGLGDAQNKTEQIKWLNERLNSLYNQALEHDGEVSLGKGQALLVSLVQRMTNELHATADENVRAHWISQLTHTFDIAQRKKIPGAEAAVRQFAFATIPQVLKKQNNQYQETARRPVDVIHATLG